MTTFGPGGHEWTDGLTHCVRCGVPLNEYEVGKPYDCPRKAAGSFDLPPARTAIAIAAERACLLSVGG